ncbi:MAG: type II toxin-antitoxin system VapC family toxin [Synechococcales bacterium]|nr:type II toxin-antitoxin system VapC family toxin [Synechococcales bacterium]
MKLLIDTHTFLWFIHDDPKLSDHAVSLLESDADLLLSTASLWEIAIKVNLQKLTLPAPYEFFIPRQIQVNRIEILPIQISHLAVAVKLPLHHRDPFDRLLISQAIAEQMSIISIDQTFDRYAVDRLW